MRSPEKRDAEGFCDGEGPAWCGLWSCGWAVSLGLLSEGAMGVHRRTIGCRSGLWVRQCEPVRVGRGRLPDTQPWEGAGSRASVGKGLRAVKVQAPPR